MWFEYIDESQLVGLDRPKAKLIEVLDVKMATHQSRLIVSVKGMPGVGKTTLVQKVYDEVKQLFQLKAWVTVSQSDRPLDVLLKILEQFRLVHILQDFGNERDVKVIVNKIRNYLSHNKATRYASTISTFYI